MEASQIAIKQLGTNGGGFFNANSAHLYEHPTPLSNLLQMASILLIPAAFCYTFGVMARDRRQGWAICGKRETLYGFMNSDTIEEIILCARRMVSTMRPRRLNRHSPYGGS